MPSVVSKARVVWEGDLFHGKGVVSFDSGAFQPTQVTWAARSSKVSGMTSPEELIAAAHASCFAMALSNILAKEGKPAQQLDVTAEVTFTVDGGAKISEVKLIVMGKVPGLDQQGFEKAAQAAGEGCPVSKALKGNLEVKVSATLA